MMKKQLIGNFCAAAILFMICGCKTPPPEKVPVMVEVEVIDTRIPLTLSVWDRLIKDMDDVSFEIKRFQLILSGRITLEREYMEQNNGSEAGGRATFIDTHTRDVITVPDQVEGQALNYAEENGEIILYVGFERNNNNTLAFSCNKEDEDGYFYLKANPPRGEEKGRINYNEQEYNVKYSGNPPVCL